MLVSKVDIRNNVEENLVLNSILVAGYIAVILDEEIADYENIGNVLGQLIKLLFFLPDDMVRSTEDIYAYEFMRGYFIKAGYKQDFPWLRIYDVIHGFDEIIYEPIAENYNRTEGKDTTKAMALKATKLAAT